MKTDNYMFQDDSDSIDNIFETLPMNKSKLKRNFQSRRRLEDLLEERRLKNLIEDCWEDETEN